MRKRSTGHERMDQVQYEGYNTKRWILEILSFAQRQQATDLVLAPASEGGASVRHKAEGAWHEWSAILWPRWPGIVSELAGLAGIREQPFPKAGIIYAAYSGVRVRWELHITSLDTGCFLHHLGNDLV